MLRWTTRCDRAVYNRGFLLWSPVELRQTGKEESPNKVTQKHCYKRREVDAELELRKEVDLRRVRDLARISRKKSTYYTLFGTALVIGSTHLNIAIPCQDQRQIKTRCDSIIKEQGNDRWIKTSILSMLGYTVGLLSHSKVHDKHCQRATSEHMLTKDEKRSLWSQVLDVKALATEIQ